MLERIKDTTWTKDNGLAGENFVFYENTQGNIKCIRQILGSGVYVTHSSIVDVQFTTDNQMKLYDKKDLSEKLYKLQTKDKLVSVEGEALLLKGKKPFIFSPRKKLDIKLIREKDNDDEILKILAGS